MSDSSVIKVLETERACVVRAMNNECNRDCSKCDLVMDAEEIIAAYDEAISIVSNAEPRLKIGDDIYFIPSEVNYKLNILHHNSDFNKVYHQRIARICLVQKGWYVEGDANVEYGLLDRLFLDRYYGVTWFTDEDKAQEALNNLGGKIRCVPLTQSDLEQK